METKIQHLIRTTDADSVVIVNTFNNDSVWVSVAVNRASAAVVMTKEQAQELIAALQQVIA